MPVTDVSAFVGAYPFRHLGYRVTPEWLLGQMRRLGIDRTWVGYLPSILHSDPASGNRALYELTRAHREKLLPVPTINPEQARWQDDLNDALAAGAPAIRLFPQYQGIEPAGAEVRVAAAAAAVAGLPVILTVRLEDMRQRHPRDLAGELPAAAVRTLVRLDPELRVLVTNADRSFIEEVHFGLTAGEAVRVLWDISWIWGPPEDHLAVLFDSIGPARFILGTGMPLRIGDAAFAKLDLLDLTDEVRAGLLGRNLECWRGPGDPAVPV